MKYIYTLYLWTVGALFFLVITLISLIGFKIFGPKKFSHFFRFLMQFLLIILLIRVKVNGIEKLKPKQCTLFMPNHTSFLDAVFLTAILPQYTIAVEEAKNLRYPVYGWLSKYYGNVPIDRSSIFKSKQSFAIAGEKLKKGQNMIIFPEGGRTLNGKLKPFKKLLFKMAKEAGQTIVPIGINGIYEMNRKGSIWTKPHKIIINFGTEISSNEIASLNIDELAEKVRKNLLETLETRYRDE